MEQSPSWEAVRSSASQEIHLLWNPKVHYCIRKSPTLVPILSQINPAHAPPSPCFKFHFNVIFPPAPRCFKWSLSIRSPHQNTVYMSPVSHQCHMTYLLIWSHKYYVVWSTYYKAPHYTVISIPITSSLLAPIILIAKLYCPLLWVCYCYVECYISPIYKFMV